MKHVLYAEDSLTSQLLLRRSIADLCEVTVTSTLAQTEAALAVQRYDLLIADYLFPEGNIFELLSNLRQSDRYHAMPIVVISSAMDALLLTRLLKIGVNDGLSKPLPPSELRLLVERMLTAPYVRTLEQSLTGVRCFQWFAHGEYHQYCPELALRLSGTSKAEVEQRMLATLEQHQAQGVELDTTSHESVVTHLLGHHPGGPAVFPPPTA